MCATQSVSVVVRRTHLHLAGTTAELCSLAYRRAYVPFLGRSALLKFSCFFSRLNSDSTTLIYFPLAARRGGVFIFFNVCSALPPAVDCYTYPIQNAFFVFFRYI